MITEAQRIERRQGLGGSDIAGILGISPWNSPVDVWLDKKGLAEPKQENEAMWWGSQEEDLVARRFCELTGKRTVNHNFMIHDGCLLANFDRLIIPDGAKVAAYHGEIRTDQLFEAKTASQEWEDAPVVEVLDNGYQVLDGEIGVPQHYLTQLAHYMGRAPSADRIYLAVKAAIPFGRFARTEFKVYVLKRDQELIDAQDAFARNWWAEYIVGDRKPDATNEAEAKKLWRVSKLGTTVVAVPDVLLAWRDYRAAKEMLKDAEKAVGDAETKIKNAMKETEALVGSDGKTVLATWRSAKDKVSTVTDWEKLARDKGVTAEEIAAATTTVTKPGSRTFLVKSSAAVVEFAQKEIAHIEAAKDLASAETKGESAKSASADAA